MTDHPRRCPIPTAVLLALVCLLALAGPSASASAGTGRAPAGAGGSGPASSGSASTGPAGTGSAGEAPRDRVAPPIPRRYLTQQITWEICSFDEVVREIVPTASTSNCAVVHVPMDWRHPDDHRDTTVAIAYTRASGMSRGLLTSNPGGPGVDGLSLTAALGLSKPQMFADYDLLGFDPRGFGASEQVECVTSQRAYDALPPMVDPRVRDHQSHLAELARAALFAKACSSSELSRYVDTQQTVYDLDFLRALLGRERLSYVGYSYGTWLGSWYADTFPSRVGRFILDSNMDWTANMDENQAADPMSFQRRRDQMLYPWIARHPDEYAMGDTVAEVSRFYERMRLRLSRLYAKGAFVPDPATVDSAIAQQIYLDRDFPVAAETIAFLSSLADDISDPQRRRQVESLPASTRDLLRTGLRPTPGRSPRGVRERSTGDDEPLILGGVAGDIVRCNDTAYSRNIWRMLERADRQTARYPFVGYNDTVTMCSFWPRRQSPPRLVDLRRSPRMLMIQSEGDPATSYEGAAAAHRRTSAATRFVSVDDEGQHGLYVDGPSPCVEQIGDAFLFDGVLPRRDRVCGTTPLPGDAALHRLRGPVRWAPAARTGQRQRAAAQQNPLLSDIRRRAAQRELGSAGL